MRGFRKKHDFSVCLERTRSTFSNSVMVSKLGTLAVQTIFR